MTTQQNTQTMRVTLRQIGVVFYNTNGSVNAAATDTLKSHSTLNKFQLESGTRMRPYAGLRFHWLGETRNLTVVARFSILKNDRVIWSQYATRAFRMGLFFYPRYGLNMGRVPPLGTWQLLLEIAFSPTDRIPESDANTYFATLRFYRTGDATFRVITTGLDLTETGELRRSPAQPAVEIPVAFDDI